MLAEPAYCSFVNIFQTQLCANSMETLLKFRALITLSTEWQDSQVEWLGSIADMSKIRQKITGYYQ